MSGCYSAGRIYYEGLGVKKDDKLAKFYFKISCDRGYKKSCEALKALNK